jgi:AcrR family transcriptional regulator
MPNQTFFNLNEEKQNRIMESAINEFSSKIYEQVNLSDIIKKAKIPRGSFYQYFEDKKDLYLHILETIKQTKLKYMGDTFYNEDIPFTDLVLLLYKQGVQFAIDHPKFVEIFDKLLNNKNDIYDEIMKENLAFAKAYYISRIEKDKEKGYIRKDLHSETLAEIVSSLTTNITINDLDINKKEASYKKMNENIKHIMDILKRGIV